MVNLGLFWHRSDDIIKPSITALDGMVISGNDTTKIPGAAFRASERARGTGQPAPITALVDDIRVAGSSPRAQATNKIRLLFGPAFQLDPAFWARPFLVFPLATADWPNPRRQTSWRDAKFDHILTTTMPALVSAPIVGTRPNPIKAGCPYSVQRECLVISGGMSAQYL